MFVDNVTGVPPNECHLIPGIPRTRTHCHVEHSTCKGRPDPEDFVVRFLWNSTH
ncbi:hypothetical protein L208DRAFT_1184935, partial [Tricholoma matsutake]